jgi:hypothetical protein
MDHTPSTSHCWRHDYSLASGGLPASLSYHLVRIGGLLPTTIFGAARTSRKNWARAIGTQRRASPTRHIHHLLPLAPIQNRASPYPVCTRTITTIPHRSCLGHRLNLLGACLTHQSSCSMTPSAVICLYRPLPHCQRRPRHCPWRMTSLSPVFQS